MVRFNCLFITQGDALFSDSHFIIGCGCFWVADSKDLSRICLSALVFKIQLLTIYSKIDIQLKSYDTEYLIVTISVVMY